MGQPPTMSSVKLTTIIFADEESDAGTTQGYMIQQGDGHDDLIKIIDNQDDFVYISSKQHAKDLIKALEKAISLGWVK